MILERAEIHQDERTEPGGGASRKILGWDSKVFTEETYHGGLAPDDSDSWDRSGIEESHSCGRNERKRVRLCLSFFDSEGEWLPYGGIYVSASGISEGAVLF